ncbi:MAG: thymidine kinase [Flammeovirgaceae bacterium]|jgi:thymidine kinase
MFIEPKLIGNKQKVGWIEVVCGSMFSGKTEELIRRVNRAVIAKQEVLIFKPAIDTRYDEVKVVSHNANAITSTPVQKAKEILELSKTAHVVAIDEAQFMDKDVLNVCIKLANKGKRVIVCGLDMDFEGKPFGMMPPLMSIAEYVTKLHAICMECGEMASYSYRLVQSKEKVMLGEKDSYEARCRRCFVKGNKEKKKDKQVQAIIEE